jgi:hypothetical protein
MKQMRGGKLLYVTMAVIIALSVVAAVPLCATQPAAQTLDAVSVFASAPPEIDGFVSESEWAGAAGIQLGSSRVLLQNDAANLYLLLDVTGDTGGDPSDYFWLTFDVNTDALITESVDVNYTNETDQNVLGMEYYTEDPPVRTEPGPSDSLLGAGFGPSIRSETPHRIWELAISLPEIDTAPGGLVRMGLRTHSEDPTFTEDTPADFTTD